MLSASTFFAFFSGAQCAGKKPRYRSRIKDFFSLFRMMIVGIKLRKGPGCVKLAALPRSAILPKWFCKAHRRLPVLAMLKSISIQLVTPCGC